MLRLALVFFLVALVAGIFNFSELSGASFWLAKVFFFVFLVLFLVTLIAAIFRRPGETMY